MTAPALSRAEKRDRMAEGGRKATVLMEALPYIRAFRGKTIVVKYGGSAMTDPALRERFAGDVSLLSMVGIRIAVVHGGGPQISRAMAQAGVEPQWVDGLRVTDRDTIRVVQSTLAGEINPEIVRLFAAHGVRAAGITGIDCDLFVARPRTRGSASSVKWRTSTRS
jgi:acetylglutamate kinase